MKPKAIILLVLLAIAIAGIMSTYSGAEKSSTFTEAAANPGDTYHITGFLAKDMPMEYDPVKDANYFSFYLKDKEGEIRKVVSTEPKQQDFEDRFGQLELYRTLRLHRLLYATVLIGCLTK